MGDSSETGRDRTLPLPVTSPEADWDKSFSPCGVRSHSAIWMLLKERQMFWLEVPLNVTIEWQFKMWRAHHGRNRQWWEELTDVCLSDLERSEKSWETVVMGSSQRTYAVVLGHKRTDKHLNARLIFTGLKITCWRDSLPQNVNSYVIFSKFSFKPESLSFYCKRITKSRIFATESFSHHSLVFPPYNES